MNEPILVNNKSAKKTKKNNHHNRLCRSQIRDLQIQCKEREDEGRERIPRTCASSDEIYWKSISGYFKDDTSLVS